MEQYLRRKQRSYDVEANIRDRNDCCAICMEKLYPDNDEENGGTFRANNNEILALECNDRHIYHLSCLL